jgi:pimeloyl-ACP methyl ester carboxylesterase
MEYWTGEDKFFRENLPKLTIPALILWGRQDKLVPIEAGELFKKTIPGAQLIIYDDGGHVLQEDLAERTAADVRAFLTAPASAPAAP